MQQTADITQVPTATTEHTLNPPLLFSTLVAALGGLLFGFDTAVISGTTDALQRVYVLDEFWLGFTVAVALIGTVVGAAITAKPCDVYGRKSMLSLIALFYLVSAIGSAIAPSWELFLFFRLLGGLAVGAASVVAPMYIAEISPANLRGRLVAVNQLNIVLGILVAFSSNYVISLIIDNQTAWRWMFGIEAVPAALFFILLFFIPRSPRWLLKQNRVEEARNVLRHLNEHDIDAKVEEIQQSLIDEKGRAAVPLFQKKYTFPIFLAFSLAMFNQLSGINALMYYAPKIFQMAGASADDALLQTITVGGTNLVFTIIALFIIDRFGRRPLLLIGSVGAAVSLTLVATQFYMDSANGSLVLIGLVGFIAAFALSQGAIIWVFLAEIMPNKIRSKGQSFGTFTHWIMAALLSWTFPIFAKASGGHIFLFFGVMMLLQFFFALKIMPETKGVSLEALERKLGITQ
jgi:MFS transporter, SP family, xylose:H+ symportor